MASSSTEPSGTPSDLTRWWNRTRYQLYAPIYDKFTPEGTEPSRLRRVLNPVARFLFSDLTRPLDPILSAVDLEVDEPRESALGGLYSVVRARPTPGESPHTKGRSARPKAAHGSE